MCLCMTGVAWAETPAIRILDLFPGPFRPLAIEPAIPKDFVMGSVENPPNLLDGVLWGMPNDLQNVIQDPSNIESTFITVRFSQSVFQVSPTRFNIEDSAVEELKKEGFKNIKLQKMNWGSYPVMTLTCVEPDGTYDYVAWAGLNLPQMGLVLQFNLLCPNPNKPAMKTDLAMWQTFLANTTELPERDMLKVYGFDLQENYTLYSYNEMSVKAYAQKRNADGQVLAIVEPLSPSTQVAINAVYEGALGIEWNHGKPCAKIDCQITVDQGEGKTDVTDVVILVLLKSVDDFDPTLLNLKSQKGVAVYQSKLASHWPLKSKRIASGIKGLKPALRQGRLSTRD